MTDSLRLILTDIGRGVERIQANYDRRMAAALAQFNAECDAIRASDRAAFAAIRKSLREAGGLLAADRLRASVAILEGYTPAEEQAEPFDEATGPHPQETRP